MIKTVVSALYKNHKQRQSKIFGKMELNRIEDQNQDSNSFYSVSNFMPLVKRQTTKKRLPFLVNSQQKIGCINYQLVQDLTVITPLQIHPKKLLQGIETYYYQRKIPSLMEQEIKKRQDRQKIDFITAFTSLFRKSFGNIQNKFVIVLPSGGMVYFLMQKTQDLPKLIVSTQSHDFSLDLNKEGINYRIIKKNDYEKERILIQGQYIRLFFGYILNWVLKKGINIQIFSNFMFEYAFKENPMIMKLNENRIENDHLCYESEGPLGDIVKSLYLIKYQTIFFPSDLQKIEDKICEFEEEFKQEHFNEKIQHDYEFKFYKFSVDISQQIFNHKGSQDKGKE